MKSSKITFNLLVIFLLTVIFSSGTLAQKDEKVKGLPDTCELISAYLDVAGDRFNKVGGEKSYLIIIGNFPKKVGNLYNDNRISDAIKYLNKVYNIRNERIISGAGFSSYKLGHLKFYVNGELVSEIKTGARGRLCFGMGETFDP